MANLVDYIKKNGQYSIKDKPLNEVDYAILTQIGYMNFTDIIPSDMKKISLKDAMVVYNEKKPTELKPFLLELLQVAGKSKRFGELKFSHLVEKTNLKTNEQFSAVMVDFDKFHKGIIYRGTDGTLNGWKEDFDMIYKFPVPAQKSASEYLSKMAIMHPFSKFSLIGHSKGGNLAMYAAGKSSRFVAPRINQVINFDGPGFYKELTGEVLSKSMLKKCITYLPEGSVVGRLLDHDEKQVVIKGLKPGLGQHCALSWNVKQGHFYTVSKTSEKSDIVDKKVREVVAKLSPEERQQFVEAIFRVIGATKMTTVNELSKNKKAILKAYVTADKNTKKIINKVVFSFVKDKKFLSAIGRKETKENVKGETKSPTKVNKPVKNKMSINDLFVEEENALAF